ncbi:MAG: hypothetical protein WCK06_04340 [Actinomycetota bacterium]
MYHRLLRRASVALGLALASIFVFAGPVLAVTKPRVLIVFLPAQAPAAGVAGLDQLGTPGSGNQLLGSFAARPGLGVGLMSATQGNYSPQQAMLDISQGSRISASNYDPQAPGSLELVVDGQGGRIAGWAAALARADGAPATIRPGLLASAIRAGVGYAGVSGASNIEAVGAADSRGLVAAVTLGSQSTVADRALDLLGRYPLVVASLPAGLAGQDALNRLLARRGPDDLFVVTQSPPDAQVSQLLPIAVAGLGFAGRGLESRTTRRDGVVTAIDLLPTTLGHLGITVPEDVRGEPIVPGARMTAGGLIELRTRWDSIAPRRIPALLAMLMACAGLLLVLGLGGWHTHARQGLRICALAFFWLPGVVLAAAAIGPGSRIAEMGVIVALTFVLAAISDRLAPWPRGPLLPAGVALVAFTIDLALGSTLTTDSLLGSNPRAGVRFFGIGNELEPLLPGLALLAVAAALGGQGRSRRGAGAFALMGFVAAVVIGYGRLGADVGGVITACAGAAAATVLMLPGGVTRRAVVIACLVPFVGVALLALLDQTTGGNGHFSRSVLEVDGTSNLFDIFKRRGDMALRSAGRGLMPAVTVGAVLASAFAIRNRIWLYAPLRAPAWNAAMIGVLVAGVVGALTNDSGPILFVASVFLLVCITAYIQGNPALVPGSDGHPGEAADVGSSGISSTLNKPVTTAVQSAAQTP